MTLIALLALIGATAPLEAQTTDLEDLPHRSVERLVQFGAIDHPVHAFSRIANLAIGPDGHLYVVQPQEREVTVLTTAGELVRRIGREGGGPGEFRSPSTVGWHGDTLWVGDAANRRTTWFHGEAVVRTARTPELETTPAESMLFSYPVPGGADLALVRRHPGPQGLAPNHNGFLVRVDPASGGQDTIGVLEENYPAHTYIGNASIAPLFHDYPHHRVQPSGETVVIVDRPFPEGDRSELRVHRVEHTGDTVYSVRLTGEAVPLDDSQWRARMEGRTFGRISPSDFLAAQRRPPNHAPASRLVVGPSGWVWIAREDVQGAEDREWVALDPEGTPRFRTTLPRDFRLYHADGDQLWGVVSGEFDVEIVRGYGVRR